MWVSFKTRTADGGRNDDHWLLTLLKTGLAAFGGGIMCPVALGMHPLPLANDVAVVGFFAGWWLVYHCPFDLVWKCMSWTTSKAIVGSAFEVFRAHNVYKFVALGAAKIAGGKLYPEASIFGPIILGTMAGSFGQFLPLNKGLEPVKNGGGWLLKSAFWASVYIHLVLNVPVVRELFPTASGMDETSVKLAVIGLFMGTTLSQIALFGPLFNPLAPLEWIFYLSTRLPKAPAAMPDSPDPVVLTPDLVAAAIEAEASGVTVCTKAAGHKDAPVVTVENGKVKISAVAAEANGSVPELVYAKNEDGSVIGVFKFGPLERANGTEPVAEFPIVPPQTTLVTGVVACANGTTLAVDLKLDPPTRLVFPGHREVDAWRGD